MALRKSGGPGYPPTKPYSWAGAANIDWFPGLNQGSQTPPPSAPSAPALPQTPQTPYDPTSNPYYQSVKGALDAQSAADAAQRRQNIQQALIAFGMVPQGFNDKYGDVDQATRDLIAKNTNSGISMYARLLDAKQQDRTALLNRLGAKGLFRSGAKGYGLRKGQLAFDRSLADSLATLMQNVGNFNSTFANNELARQQSLANALASAYQSYVPPASSSSSFVGSPFASGYAGYYSPYTGVTYGASNDNYSLAGNGRVF